MGWHGEEVSGWHGEEVSGGWHGEEVSGVAWGGGKWGGMGMR